MTMEERNKGKRNGEGRQRRKEKAGRISPPSVDLSTDLMRRQGRWGPVYEVKGMRENKSKTERADKE